MKVTLSILLMMTGACSIAPQASHLNGNDSGSRSIFLGAAFDSQNKTTAAVANLSCVSPAGDLEYSFQSRPTATIKTDFSRSYDYHYDQFTVDLQASAGLIEAHLTFLESLKNSKLSTALITQFDYGYGTLKLENPELNLLAKGLLTSEDRYRRCGDSFIDEIDVGAKFYAALVFNFKEWHETDKLEFKVLLNLLFTSVNLFKVELAKYKNPVETSVDFKVFQVGGDQEAFAALKNDLSRENCGYIRKTEVKDPNPDFEMQLCLKNYNKALAYARGSFHQQLTKAKKSPKSEHGLASLAKVGFHAKRYSDAGFWWFQPSAESQQRLQSVELRRKAQQTLSAYRGTVLSLDAIQRDRGNVNRAFSLTEERYQVAIRSLKCAQNTVKVVENALEACGPAERTDPVSCLEKLKNLSVKAIPYFGEPVLVNMPWNIEPCNP